MRVLIVDDSIVFRSQINAVLSSVKGVEVIGSAANGKIALAKLEQTPADLITLDVEMPELNGIETLKELRRRGNKAKVIMFSSLTARGAVFALDALRNGADDVVGKPSGEGLSLETAGEAVAKELVPKVLQFINGPALPASTPKLEHFVAKPVEADATKPAWRARDISFFKPQIVVIGCSTGGPKALEDIFSQIKGKSRVPILIVQHMPPVFTKCLADRLQELTGIEANEAKHMEPLLPNKIYIAPGNYHMSLIKGEAGVQLKLDQGPQQNMVRPAVDPLFQTAAALYGEHCMSFVLTGMGEDGLRGAKAIKDAGGGVMIQNRESCVVFGMPGAIFNAKAYDNIGTLQEITTTLQDMVRA